MVPSVELMHVDCCLDRVPEGCLCGSLGGMPGWLWKDALSGMPGGHVRIRRLGVPLFLVRFHLHVVNIFLLQEESSMFHSLDSDF